MDYNNYKSSHIATKIAMRYHQTFNSIIGQGSKLKVLRVLAQSGEDLNGREIARSAGLAQRIVHVSLLALFKSGIVLMRKSGKSNLYRINAENILVSEALLPLFKLEKTLLKKVSDKIKNAFPRVISIILFGSVAAGKEGENSDLDLLVVFPQNADLEAAEKIFDNLNFDISKKFGNGISPLALTVNEIKKRYKSKNAFFRNIVESGRLLYGKTIMELVYGQ